MKPTKCPAREKKMRQELSPVSKRKKWQLLFIEILNRKQEIKKTSDDVVTLGTVA